MGKRCWMVGIFMSFCLLAGFSLSAQTDKGSENLVKNITQEEFRKLVFDYSKSSDNWVYKGDVPVIVDFYADWCMPCRRLTPILKDLAMDYRDKVLFYKIDVDQNKVLADVFGIQSIPTLLYIPKTGKPTMVKGLRSKDDLDKMIRTLLLK